MKKILLRDLRDASAHRAPGYYEEAVASGRVEGGFLYLEDDKYLEIRQKFSSPPPHKTITHLTNPGSLLAILIHALTGKQSKDCSACSQRAKQMNAWGWIGCWQYRKTIAGWLVEEAAKLGTTTDEAHVIAILRTFFARR